MLALSTAYVMCKGGGRENPFIGKQMRFWQRTRANLVKIIKHEVQESRKVSDARSFPPIVQFPLGQK